MWQYGNIVRQFIQRFNIYVPDLLFFGRSFTTRPERTEAFQAECLMKVMKSHGVKKLSLVGVSYGGFVGYNMAMKFPEALERLVLCCAGVCLEEKDMEEGLFAVSDLDEAARTLMPQTPEKLRDLMRLSFVKPIKGVPSYFLSDFIEVRTHTICAFGSFIYGSPALDYLSFPKYNSHYNICTIHSFLFINVVLY